MPAVVLRPMLRMDMYRGPAARREKDSVLVEQRPKGDVKLQKDPCVLSAEKEKSGGEGL